MKTAAIIVAAGRGLRAGGEVPKQWQALSGARVLDHTLRAFQDHPAVDDIVLVLHPDDLTRAPDGVAAVPGGATRCASVRAGLEHLADAGCALALIHDVARPCISARVISAVIDALGDAQGAAPALPVSDALWTGEGGKVTGMRDRTGLYRAQTPQGFHFGAILAAHRASDGAAMDDVEVARAAGMEVVIVAGDEDNLKITYPEDFARAEQILEVRHGYPARERL